MFDISVVEQQRSAVVLASSKEASTFFAKSTASIIAPTWCACQARQTQILRAKDAGKSATNLAKLLRCCRLHHLFALIFSNIWMSLVPAKTPTYLV
jgi:hypothetical protein